MWIEGRIEVNGWEIEKKRIFEGIRRNVLIKRDKMFEWGKNGDKRVKIGEWLRRNWRDLKEVGIWILKMMRKKIEEEKSMKWIEKIGGNWE